MKSLQIFTIFENCPADRLKVEKNWVYKGTSSRYFQFCVFFLYLKFGVMNFFFYQQALGRTNMFNGPANLRKFHRRKSDKFYSNDPYFRCRKTLRNGIEIRQDRYLSKRGLSNLPPFGSLSHGVFFSVDLFFRREGL